MFKLTIALLLLVSGCWAQCTSDSCGETDSMQNQLKVVMQRLDQLASENIELTLENKKQTATIEGLKSNIIEQETVNQELRTTNAELRTTVNSLQMNISHIQMTSTDLQTSNDQLRETVSSLQSNVTKMQATSPATAAYFSVAANRDISYNAGEAIKFGHTYTNMVPTGTTGGWDAATNMYTCPVDGDYMLVVTLYKADNSDYNTFSAFLIHTSLSGADTRIVYLYNYKHSSVSALGTISFSSTMQAIVPCAEGEKVWVRVDCNGCHLWDTEWHFNTFTGFKL